MPPLESILQFPNPATPDLGCFVRRKHEFQTDPDVDFLNVHVSLIPRLILVRVTTFSYTELSTRFCVRRRSHPRPSDWNTYDRS